MRTAMFKDGPPSPSIVQVTTTYYPGGWRVQRSVNGRASSRRMVFDKMD
jgi:hypothetical protein